MNYNHCKICQILWKKEKDKKFEELKEVRWMADKFWAE